MASKVLVPAAPAPFTKLHVKKSPPEPAGSGFIISGDPTARVTHLEHSVRFLQEQHRLMLSGLHAEIEALRERNRDLQFQLIFNKESSPKPTSPTVEENVENNEEVKLKREVSQLEKAVSSARGDAREAEARALELQRLVDAQAEKIRQLELQRKCDTCEVNAAATVAAAAGDGEDSVESRAELRARLADAEKLVRRLRSEAERRRRELQCMKNSLHASLRATGLDAYGFQNNYHFPPVHHTPDFWREPIREEVCGVRGRGSRRPLTLPELAAHQPHRSTVYANNHTTRPRANGYENKNKKPQQPTNEVTNGKSSEQEQSESRLDPNYSNILPNIINKCNMEPNATFPELKIVVTKMITHGNVSTTPAPAALGASEARSRPRRPHRKHGADHT